MSSTAMTTQAERDAEWGRPHGRKWQPTGRMIWLEAHADSGSAFADRAFPENMFHREARFGTQSGTYWKTARLHDGMTVWRWGGMPLAERQLVAQRINCPHGTAEWLPCPGCLSTRAAEQPETRADA